MFTHRPYHSDADLALLLNWLGDNAQTAHMHPGDLTWWLRQNTGVDPARALRLFFSAGGELRGFVFSDPPTWAVMHGAAHLPASVWDAMIVSAEDRAGGAVTFNAHEADGPQVAALGRAGYAPTAVRLAQLERVLEPGDREAVPLPSGFRFTDMRCGDVSAAARVNLHREVWHPSKVTLEAYAHLQAAPNYRAELDVMVVAPSGEPVSSALGWFDPISRAGLLEPVGTHASFRRQGLGRPLILELTHRLGDLGAQRISVATRETNAAALGLYRAAGYKVTGYWADHRKR